MYVAAVLVTICAVSRAAAAATVPLPEKEYYDLEDAENLFQDFIEEYNRHYDSLKEYNERFAIFKQTLERINEQNSRYPQTVFGVNNFADMTPEEFNSYLGFIKPPITTENEAVDPILPDEYIDVPAAFDWRDKGVVSPVKDQGGCGSCYIFSAIGNIEGQYAMKHQQCIALSEQQCLDCLPDTTCQGGFPHDVMQKLSKDKAGSMKEDDYQYLGVEGNCHEDQSKQAVTVLSGDELKITDEDVLQKALVKYGPLSVGLNATDLLSYTGGVLHPSLCADGANHAVLLIGYGEDNGEKFWIMKNSWSARWGEEGYGRILRGVNACGIGTSYTATSQVA